MLVAPVAGQTALLVISLGALLARNAHHAHKGGKDIYTLPLFIRLLMIACTLLIWVVVLSGQLDAVPGKPNSWAYELSLILFLAGFTLAGAWIFLYRVSVDDTAIYCAGIFKSTVRFENVTRVIERQTSRARTVPWTTIYAKGALFPAYISGMLGDYDDLMSKIRDGCQKIEDWETR